MACKQNRKMVKSANLFFAHWAFPSGCAIMLMLIEGHTAGVKGGKRMYNRFAEMRRRYLREHRDGIYTGMLLTGKLDEHLKEIGDTAQEMFDRLVAQMKDAEGVTERLKAENQMEWVGRMNSIRSRAEEVVLSELVYC